MRNLDFMLQTLVNLVLYYLQTGRMPARLWIPAEDWAEDLAAFPRDIVEWAARTHRRESPYLPTVADIWRRYEELHRGSEAHREAEWVLPGRILARDEQVALNTDWRVKTPANLRGKMERGRRGGCGRVGRRACACGAFSGRQACGDTVAKGCGARGLGDAGHDVRWRGSRGCRSLAERGSGIRKRKEGMMSEL